MDQYLMPGESFKRLLKEYKEHASLWVAFDFDGTVHDYHKQGHTYPMVIELLRELKAIGCKCVCWSAYESHEYIKDYCKENSIPCDGINSDGIPLKWQSRKPFYSVILDDRAGLYQVYTDLSLLVHTIKTCK